MNRSNYISHKWFSSVAVGNYLYIDGGEVYYKNGNNTVLAEAKSTYSIAMSSSWTNQTVSVKQINKAIDCQSLNYPNLWPALDNSSFYSYNGAKGWFNSPANLPPNKLYKFTPDGSGGSLWSEDAQAYTASSNFTNLARVDGSASVCGGDTCYAVGGYRNSRTDDGVSDSRMPASRMVSYNLTSHTWYNNSLIGTVFQKPWYNGQLFFTDIASEQGVLIAIGGATPNLAGLNSASLNFNVIYVFDIAHRSWYEQNTTGDVPALPRSQYCTVGIRGDNTVNKTYEIFMYGGFSTAGTSISLDDVWVLSLPSFEWHRAGHTPVRGRSGLSCTVVGGRQMAIIGGLDPDSSDQAVDTWPLGLGMFDLGGMVFKDRYDADAGAYMSPEVVKRWHVQNGPIAQNVNDYVKMLFIQSSTTGPSASSSPLPTSSDSPGLHNKGPIAGGVVGGLIVFAALVAGAWFYTRRKRLQGARKQHARQILESDGRARYEADGRQTYEKEAQQRHELL